LVSIAGVMDGMVVTAAQSTGDDRWQIPVTDAAAGKAWIVPPEDYIGAVDLLIELHLADGTIADRRSMHLEWQDPRARVPAVSRGLEHQSPPAVPAAPSARARPSQPQLDRDEIAVLVARGKELISEGDFTAARVLLQRAAEAPDANAALVLAATYDPILLRELKVYGIAPDIILARSWYLKAQELGSAEAARRLEAMAHRGR